MGLKEKQAIASLDFSSSEKSLKEYTGIDFKFELAADSFANDIDAIWAVSGQRAQEIQNGLGRLTNWGDEKIAKEALSEKKLTKISLVNQPAGNRSIKIVDNSLIIASAFKDGNDSFSDREICETISNML